MGGIDIWDLNLKQPPPSQAMTNADSGSNSWLNWFPKIGVFGIALVGVVIWNVKKASQQRTETKGFDDLDDEDMKELIRDRREKKQAGGGDFGRRGDTIGANRRVPRAEDMRDDYDDK